MKILKWVIGCLIFISAIAISVSAQDATDNAGNYTNWTYQANLGTGFTGPWTFSNTGTSSQSGAFLGNSTENGAGGGSSSNHPGINSSANNDAWGLYANGGQTAGAIRAFPAFDGLNGQYLTIDFENGYVNNPSSPGGGGTIGLGLLDASGNNLVELFFVGGNNCYTLYNGASNQTNNNTDIGFSDTGLAVTFTSTNSGNDVNVTITGLNGAGSFSTNNFPLERSGDEIAEIRLFNANAGSGGSYNDFYNNLTVVPEPSSIALVAAGLLGALAFIRRRKA